MTRRILALVLIIVAVGVALPDLSRPLRTGTDGERHFAGQLIVELTPDLRGQVELSTENGVALFGIPALDELNRSWRVNDVTKLLRHPNPSANFVKLGCDLQYIIQFDQDQDIAPVAEAYEASPVVDCAVPNAWMAFDEVPDDPSYSGQWHLPAIGAPYAWGVSKGDTTVWNLVLDDGVDWEHPDIEANLWINGPEDINGNHRFDNSPAPGGDLDGIDNDGNGYADDVIGWDFVAGDNDPMPNPGDNHGTHCWGNINAVTNNATGVAGVTWNSHSFGVRCGGGGGVSLYAAIAAIYWGIPEGVWAVSMSFGGNSPYQPMADACQAAWDDGAVLYGSAGNDGSEVVRYPACYNGVENVAATSYGDMKSSFSNYGDWVDVSAPGSSIYATYTRGSGSYGSMDGTSMSCPMAAGVACWMKSFDMGMDNNACTSRMHAACDSMPDPLYAQGKLGAGRVSMANVVLPLYYCDLKLTGWRFNDASGNNNGRPDPGETVALIVTYFNTGGWQNATGVSAELAVNAPDVVIVKGTATFPNIPNGSSGNCSADSFVLRLPPGMPPQNLNFHLTASATPEPAWPDTGFTAQAGEPRVLIVDDDLGADYEKWYTSACDSNGVLYSVYDVNAQGGTPCLDTLMRYPVVIWYTGKDSVTTLGGDDIEHLGDFLDAGHKLLLSGQNIADQLQGNAFLADYLHAEFVVSSTGKPFLVGIPGDPVTEGDTMVAGGGGGANNGTSLDGVHAINGGIGSAFFKDYGDTTVYAVVRYKEAFGYGVVFFSVPFEAIDHSCTIYLQKWTLIKRILAYFGEPVPGVEEAPPQVADKRPYVLSISPNPFARSAAVNFIAPVTGRVELNTYTISGRLVDSQAKTVTLGERASFRLDGEQLSNGVYLVQLVTPDGIFAQKTAVLK